MLDSIKTRKQTNLGNSIEVNKVRGPMVKLGVISDTHVKTVEDIPFSVRNALANVDLIIHAGDLAHKAVLDGLRAIGKVQAVRGNMDSGEVKKILHERYVFEVNEKKIGLIHGSGAPWGIAERVKKEFKDVDVVVFGHSHQPCNRYIQGVLLFNPGQAKYSFGILDIEEGITARIFRV
jgi:putative phosphoesterase